ncbi:MULTISPECIES: hypothetical protein [Pseudomonas]|uniref:hypothetical protein n=1 Tax=Pseudomonas TaxID=286 RepID=UPI000B089C72|nr:MULTISPECIES: hypothetical protein [Pseudomonas]
MKHGCCVALLAAQALTAAMPAQAGLDSDVFTGTLGTQSIVLELDRAVPEDVSGRYFYVKHHHDLQLTGSIQGTRIQLVEGHEPAPEAGIDSLPTLALWPAAQGGLQGEWQSPQGKRLPITLLPARLPQVPSGADPFLARQYTDSPYEYLRLMQLPLKPGELEHFQGYPLRWLSEPSSGISLFVIEDGYPAQQLTRLNQLLRARLSSDVVAYHQCMLLGRPGGYYRQTVTPRFMSNALLSVSIVQDYSCDGTPMLPTDAPFNLAVESGKELTLDDVLWVGEGKPFHYEYQPGPNPEQFATVSFGAYVDYRSRTFAPWLLGQLKQLYPQHMLGEVGEDGCDYAQAQVWQMPTWRFTPEGIQFDPVFDSVQRHCRGVGWAVLPYRIVRQHAGGVALELPE